MRDLFFILPTTLVLFGCTIKPSSFESDLDAYLILDNESLIDYAYPILDSIGKGNTIRKDHYSIIDACLLAPLDGIYSEQASDLFYEMLAHNNRNQRYIEKALNCLTNDTKEKALPILTDYLLFAYFIRHDKNNISFSDYYATFQYLARNNLIHPSEEMIEYYTSEWRL